MKVESHMSSDNVIFKNFIVIKKKDTYYSVHEVYNGTPYGQEITHGETLRAACKKAKLLQIGYNICKDNIW